MKNSLSVAVLRGVLRFLIVCAVLVWSFLLLAYGYGDLLLIIIESFLRLMSVIAV